MAARRNLYGLDGVNFFIAAAASQSPLNFRNAR
jgi:hypothetical protein